MRLEVHKLAITRGEFSVVASTSGVSADELCVVVDYALMSKSGEVLARGQISNVAAVGGAKMAPATLTAFADFFRLLEQDVVNALESKDVSEEDVREKLVRNLG